MSSNRVFVTAFLILLIGSLMAVAGFSALMDSYRLFGTPVHAGFNDAKPSGNSRITKVWQVARGGFDGLILGNSRSDAGINPEHPAWQGFRAYNFSQPAASLYESFRSLQHAQASHPLRRVLLSVDFAAFIGDEHIQIETFAEARLRVDRHFQPQSSRYFWRDAANILFSEEGLEHGRETWHNSRRGGYPEHTVLGWHNPLGWQQQVRERGGYRIEFLRSERSFIRPGGIWARWPEGSRFQDDPDAYFPAMRLFEELLVFCHERNIELHLFTSPIHGRMQLGLYALGLQPAINAWKRELAAVNERVAARYGREPFPLRDFAVINSYTRDPVPATGGEPDGMQWYWDSSHYRHTLGDLIQNLLFFGETVADPHFGQPLTNATVDAWLARQEAALADYRRQSPDDWQDVVQMARQAGVLAVNPDD